MGHQPKTFGSGTCQVPLDVNDVSQVEVQITIIGLIVFDEPESIVHVVQGLSLSTTSLVSTWVTDRHKDTYIDIRTCRAAFSQLKTHVFLAPTGAQGEAMSCVRASVTLCKRTLKMSSKELKQASGQVSRQASKQASKQAGKQESR